MNISSQPVNIDRNHPRSRTELLEIQFRSYKALRHFDLSFKRTNILVGPNNFGKSTVIGALRILAAGLRKANAIRPVGLQDETRHTFGWELSNDAMPVSLENVHTDYADTDTTVLFKFSNGNSLKLFFPSTGGCRLVPVVNGRTIQNPSGFRDAFPFKLAVIPVLGPIEHREQRVNIETVQRNLDTHRAARNFRNYWLHFPDGFDHFADLIRSTWPSMDVKRPFMENHDPIEVFMFTEESHMPRELFWCGFGFQIWCQLLTHISRNHDADLIVVDEPEVYLHPDVQRQLLGILRDAGPAVALATHSTEIMAEAEPSELILIDKERNSGRRLANARAVQAAFAQIGSIHNVSIVQADKTRKVLFVEDTADYAIIKRFAKVVNMHRLANDTSISALPSGGYGSWKEIKGFAQRIEQATKEKYRVAAIYDRDYRCEEELDYIATALREHLEFAWILGFKEIENYLLNPFVLDRLIASQLEASGREPVPESEIGSAIILEQVTETLRHDAFSQYAARRNEYTRQRGKDESTSLAVTSKWFDERWPALGARLRIVPGKDALSDFRTIVGEKYKVTFSNTKIAESFTKDDIPGEIQTLLDRLDTFARQ